MSICQNITDTELLVDFLDGSLPLKHHKQIHQHIRICPSCRKFHDSYQKTLQLCHGLSCPSIPSERAARLQKFCASYGKDGTNYHAKALQQEQNPVAPTVKKESYFTSCKRGGPEDPPQYKGRCLPADHVSAEAATDKLNPLTQETISDRPQNIVVPKSPFKNSAQAKASLSSSPRGEKQEELAGGRNTSYLIELEDGTQAVYKPVNGEYEELRDGVKAGTYWRREAAASSVADILGFSDLVPPTVMREDNQFVGSLQLYHSTGNAAIKYIPMGMSKLFDGPENAARSAIFDYLIGHLDRHCNNWLIDDKGTGQTQDDKLVLIDNGLSFPTEYASSDIFQMDMWRHAIKNQYKVPQEVSKWQRKWPEVQKALEGHGLESAAIQLTKERFDALVNSAGQEIAQLPFGGHPLEFWTAKGRK
ncbi:MAG: zf-HC2 domain-containing protein [Patescibacteria group bacterium]|nr:zf-HC2 domain-containing protein [Patescibacteria group bacterium]